MNTPSTIFANIIIFLLGISIGSLVQRALQKRKTPPSNISLPPMSIPTQNTLAQDGDVEIFRAWRTLSNAVWLEMDGQRIGNKAALQPAQRQRLLKLVLDLRPWLDASRTAAPAPVVPPSPAQPAPVPQVVQPGLKKNAPGIEEPKTAPVLETIIQQIDKVLQQKLATSAYQDRGIQLIEGPGGVVLVKDGINRYEGVDAVPDPQIQALIRQAVADWEKGTR